MQSRAPPYTSERQVNTGVTTNGGRWIHGATGLEDNPDHLLNRTMQITINIQSLQTLTLDVEPTSTIRQVKNVIEAWGRIPYHRWGLFFAEADEELPDHCTLEECHITAQCSLSLFEIRGIDAALPKRRVGKHGLVKPQVFEPVRLDNQVIEHTKFSPKSAGHLSIGIDFNSLSTPVIHEFSETGPDYCRVSPGLSFKSKCTHPGCAAYNHVVYISKHFGFFNIAVESVTLKCPKCKNKAKRSTNCGFYLAKWKFNGLTQEGERVEIPGKTTTRKYHTWKKGDDTNWAQLEVQVDQYEP